MKNFFPVRGSHRDLMTGETIPVHPTVYCPKKMKKMHLFGLPNLFSSSTVGTISISGRSPALERGEKRTYEDAVGLTEKFTYLNTQSILGHPIQVSEENRIFRLVTQPKSCQRKAYEKESRYCWWKHWLVPRCILPNPLVISGEILHVSQIKEAYASVSLVTFDLKPLPAQETEDLVNTKGPMPLQLNRNGQFVFSLKVK